MPQFIDVSAVDRPALSIKDARGREWKLRDTVRTEALLGVFGLYELDDQIAQLSQDDAERSPEDLRASLRQFAELVTERVERTTDICEAIFQASYPDLTREQVCEILPSYADRRLLAETFFGLLFAPSRTVSSASPEPPSDAKSDDDDDDEPPASAPAMVTPKGPRQALQTPQPPQAAPRGTAAGGRTPTTTPATPRTTTRPTSLSPTTTNMAMARSAARMSPTMPQTAPSAASLPRPLSRAERRALEHQRSRNRAD